MIEETAKVIRVDDNWVWVRAIAQSACGSCQAQKGCGHSLLAKVGQRQIDIQLPRQDYELSVNDDVIIGVPEQAVLRSSLLMYGVPLLLMLVVAGLASVMSLAEGAVILLAFLALISGFFYVSRWSNTARIEEWHPRIIRKALNQETLIPICEIKE
ncbi:SoxR reducing system RseC family protein [Bermanella marisrubri]|uniref:Sigma factor algU negative regulatory protein MucC n=1 Tax=Bermanella marisrubri TaxID=207949 RepID=Q1N1C0_9GAMM|nr:SoxR reducing system RseC family protein [Bermanella marisrubri]EAT12130.1 sigma factor algU negative regulatory protein MucC [Oceanobacter sp. RED65] [Bermanella marisrubri]QIZ83593.1 SoxR reducing system RseC family protein [Bermanella marisrubri]